MKSPKYSITVIFVFLFIAAIASYTIITGWNFGKVKAQFWLSTIGLTFFGIVFIIEPLKVLIGACYQTFFKTEHKEKFIDNIQDSELSEVQQLKQRCDQFAMILRKSLYEPISSEEKDRLKKKMRKEQRMENLLSDILLFVAFLTCLTIISIQRKIDLTYYSSRQIENYLVNGIAATDPLSDVNSDEDLKMHLQTIFLLAIHNATDSKNRVIKDGNGWISDKTVRMLGVPRLRQTRVKFVNCGSWNCVPEFSKSYEESRNFRVGWRDEISSKYENKFWRVADPWKFQSIWKLNILSYHGILATYPGSGYASQLGRTGNNSLTTFKYLMEANWIDRQTKALSIETTFYSPDSGIFNVVTLGLERTAFGNWITSHKIFTAEFLIQGRNFGKLLVFAAFVMVLFVLTRKTIRKMASKTFFGKISNIVDLVIIIVAFTWICALLAKHFFVSILIKRLRTLRNNEFVSFQSTVISEFISQVCYGFLVSITAIRLWNILNFSQTFRSMNLTIYYAAYALISTWFLLIIVLVGFSSAIHIINGSESELFTTLMNTFTAMTAQTLKFNKKIQDENVSQGGMILSLSMLAFLMLLVNILLMNMVSSIVVLYSKQVKNKLKEEKVSKVSLWIIAKKRFWRMLKIEEKELTFLHRNYTNTRTEHIKRTIDAQIEFLHKHLEASNSGEFIYFSSITEVQ